MELQQQRRGSAPPRLCCVTSSVCLESHICLTFAFPGSITSGEVFCLKLQQLLQLIPAPAAVQCSAVEGRPVFWLLSTNAPAVRHPARPAGRQSPSLSGYYCLLLSRPGCSTRFKQPAAAGSQGPALWLLLHQTCGCCRKAPEVISSGPGLNLALARKRGGRNLQRVQLRKRDAQPLDARPAVIAIIFAARSGEKEARASARNFIQGESERDGASQSFGRQIDI